MLSPPDDVDALFALLRVTSAAADPAADPDAFDTDRVDELTHALQTAAGLAERRPADLELQVAGLVHDLGHLAAAGDPDAHGRAGADLVRPLLGRRVAELVELHVPAKRYLVATDPGYREVLSPGSIHTLELEGGPLASHEVAAFAARPEAQDALVLRRADDEAKDPARVVPDLEHWRPIVEAVAR
jgi:predicted HD phosphohydrolase